MAGRMWLAPNLPDEEEGKGERRGASLVVRVSAPLPRRQRPKQITTMIRTKRSFKLEQATHHIVLKAPQDVCVPL